MSMPSPWTGKPVDVDPYGPNPMLESLRVENPTVHGIAIKGDPAPTMFVGGDLPAFTASGIDPKMLLQFPWRQRHGVAAEADPAAVYFMSQENAPDVLVELNTPGLNSFMARMRRWAINSNSKRDTP